MLRQKYPISDWVISQDNIKPGDIIAFYCDEEECEVQAEVLGFPSPDLRQYISCKRVGIEKTEVVNFYNTIVYRIHSCDEINFSKKCSCGARFTSNPRFHLTYCDLHQIRAI